MPAFQAAATIDEAIASVVGQSLEDWELIVADDGSGDRTREAVVEWARRDPRIRLVTHPDGANHGRPATRNLTIASARGEIVAFLDSDDLLLDGALEMHVGVLRRTPDAAVSYGRGVVRGGLRDGRVIGRGLPGRSVGLLEQLARFNVLVTSATAVRRRALGDAPFPADMPLCQDWACWLDLARRERFVHLKETLSVYRDDGAGGTAAVLRERGPAAYELIQARHLRRALRRGTAAERRAMRSGLAFRATTCLLGAVAALRRGRIREGLEWLATALRISGGAASLIRSVAQAPGEQRRIWRGEDPPLRLELAPLAPGRSEPAVEHREG